MQILKKTRILIVGDETITSTGLCEKLESFGYFSSYEVYNIHNTFNVIEKEKPDLVLIETKIHDEIDRIETATDIKNKFQIPVIFICDTSENIILEKLSYGCIVNPFTDKELNTAIEITLIRHRAEKEINRLNRLYLFTSQVNQAIVRCHNQEELLQTICKIAINIGGYNLAWIGFIDETTKQVTLTASAGTSEGYLEKITIYADDRPDCCGLIETAIKTKKPYIIFDHQQDPHFRAWWNLASPMGFKSAAAFPLFIKENVIGALMLYSSDIERFNQDELKLLQEVSNNISYALNNFAEVEIQKHSEKQISDLNALYTSLVESIQQALFRKDREGKFIFGNTRFCNMLGQSFKDIAGTTAFTFQPKNLAEKYRNDDLKVIETGESSDTIEEFTTTDGKKTLVRVLKSPVRDGAGNIIGVQGIFWDVTKEKEFEELLKIQSIALESAAYGILIINNKGIITFANSAIEKMSGYTREELIGENISILRSNIHKPEFYSIIRETINAGKVWQGEEIKRRKDGTNYPVELIVTPIISNDGKIEHFVYIQQDISEKNELDTQIHRMQRLARVATLAGGIAHNINNSLTPIIMSAELLKDEFIDSESQLLLNTIIKCAERSADLIYQVLAVTRGVEIKKEAQSPAEIIKEVCVIINHTFPKTITIDTYTEENIRQIKGDRGYLNQMLLNLCMNAREAMPQGGILKISAKNFLADESFSKHFINAKPGKYILFEVVDTGCGIPPENIERIFDPFFTTKDIGKGSGMGLSTAQSIAKSHNGFIAVHSAVGTGSTFQVYIPAEDNILPLGK